jgi:hypothetical protein
MDKLFSDKELREYAEKKYLTPFRSPEGKTRLHDVHHEEREAARRQIPGNLKESISRSDAEAQWGRKRVPLGYSLRPRVPACVKVRRAPGRARGPARG